MTNAVCTVDGGNVMDVLKAELMHSMDPMRTWFFERGSDFAVRLVAAALIFVLGAICIRILKKTLAKALSRWGGERAFVARFFFSVVIKCAWAVLLVLVLGKLGVDMGPIIAGLGVTGFVVGFAFQESLGSFAAGLMLAINRPFKVGDYVIVAGYEGRVTSLDMMAMTLATADNRKVTIPNRQAWGAPIVNYSALELRRVDLVVGIAYGADIGRAKDAARTALAGLPMVLSDPGPLVEVKSLDDSAVTLTVRVWVKNADYWPAFFAGNRAVKEAFDAAGVSIPFPQVDVHLSQA